MVVVEAITLAIAAIGIGYVWWSDASGRVGVFGLGDELQEDIKRERLRQHKASFTLLCCGCVLWIICVGVVVWAGVFRGDGWMGKSMLSIASVVASSGLGGYLLRVWRETGRQL